MHNVRRSRSSTFSNLRRAKQNTQEKVMLFYSLMVALFFAALLSDNKHRGIATLLFLVPTAHFIVSPCLGDFQYYSFAFTEDLLTAWFLFMLSRSVNHRSAFIIQLAFISMLFMMAQMIGWVLYVSYYPVTIYDNICSALFALQILIIIKDGGARDEFIRLAKYYFHGSTNNPGRIMDHRNGNHT